jgi:hypothetical protein
MCHQPFADVEPKSDCDGTCAAKTAKAPEERLQGKTDGQADSCTHWRKPKIHRFMRMDGVRFDELCGHPESAGDLRGYPALSFLLIALLPLLCGSIQCDGHS